MPKKTKILLALFLVLLTVVAFSIYQRKDVAQKEIREIAIKDTAAIAAIYVERPGKPALNLKKIKGKWILNEQYEARDYLLQLFIVGLNKMQARREVSASVAEEVKDSLKTKGDLVHILDKNGKLISSFFLMRNPNDPNSSYYLPKNGQTPLAVIVPGFEGSIANVFQLDTNEWRTKVIFSANERTLKSVQIEYPMFPEESFSIVYNNSHFTVPEVKDLDTNRLFVYLDNYKFLTIFKYLDATNDSVKSLIQGKKPLAILSAVALGDEEKIIIYENHGTFVGVLPEEKEIVSLRPKLYNNLLVKKSFFKKQE